MKRERPKNKDKVKKIIITVKVKRNKIKRKL
jgi:hypothetical protein